MSVKKFSRCTNFSCSEESKLITLVNKYQHIVECKKTDEVSGNVKKEVWQKIGKEFNAAATVYRDEKVLKTKYENMKKRTKQKFSEEKKYTNGTGGGPPKPTKYTDTDENIKEILGARLTGLSSHFDNDATLGVYLIYHLCVHYMYTCNIFYCAIYRHGSWKLRNP